MKRTLLIDKINYYRLLNDIFKTAGLTSYSWKLINSVIFEEVYGNYLFPYFVLLKLINVIKPSIELIVIKL